MVSPAAAVGWHCVYHAQIHKRAMKPALPFGRGGKVGLPAMVEQAGAGGKDRIKRQTCLLQGDGAEKNNIQSRARAVRQPIGSCWMTMMSG